jgi:hypothetical protein
MIASAVSLSFDHDCLRKWKLYPPKKYTVWLESWQLVTSILREYEGDDDLRLC